MSGFSNPIVGGGGALVYPAIHSPNFVHGATGWSLNKDGSAEFHSVSLPTGAGGNVITLAAGAPSGPGITAGDLWFNLGLGTVSVWTGSAWVNFAYGTGAIASSAVGLAQLSGAVTARALNGITTTIAASPPASPKAGDIWINSASGNQLEQYNGSAFVPIAWNAASVISASTITAALIAANTITAGQIAANTITAAQLAAGIVYAGIVDATTITGATFVATGSSGEILAYTGTPALGNLLATVSGANGTDAQGNAIKAGLAIYDGVGGFIQVTESGNVGIINFAPGTATHITKDANILGAVVNPAAANEYEALQVQSGAAGGHNVTTVQLLSDSADGTLTGVIKMFYENTVVLAVGNDAITANAPVYLATDTPGTPAAAVLYEGGTGHLLYKDKNGAVYDTGRITAHAANGSSGQVISSTGFTLIAGMSVSVGVGIYRVRIVVDLTTAAAAGRWELQLGGTAATSTVDYSFFWTSGAGVSGGAVHQVNPATTQVGPNPSVIGPYHAAYEGIIRFTSAGTFTVTAATTVAADTFTVWDGSCMTLDPIV